MAEIVRAGLIQQRWTGDKDSMIAAAVNHIQTAASDGAAVVCLQELFYGPYFCQVQDATTTPTPRRSRTGRPPGCCRTWPGSTAS